MALSTRGAFHLPLLLLAAAFAAAGSARAGDLSVVLNSGAGFAVKDNTGTIERLRVDEATGNVSRNGALFVHTTGLNSLFVGAGAGNPSTTGPRNSAFGATALASNTTGSGNSAFGYEALRNNTTGTRNAAFGVDALSDNTTAWSNSAFGYEALRYNTTGGTNSAFGAWALRYNSTGGGNSAFGYQALGYNGTGSGNSAFGYGALYYNTAGSYNSAFGVYALQTNSGWNNVAVGFQALRQGNTGDDNNAVGHQALSSNTTGRFNSAVGSYALSNNSTGNKNVAVGYGAGVYQTTGHDNIYLANTGVAAENGQIKIGTAGTHTKTTIAGIRGATAAGGITVLVDTNGVLGTTTSSARFKQDVRDMGDASDVLMKLHPVTFHYREDVVGPDEAKTPQYGLIAEEVEEVAPELVAPDLEGRPYSVKYHELPSLLVNEAQKLHRALAEQQRKIDEQAALIAAQRAQNESLDVRVEQLEERLGTLVGGSRL